MTPSNAILLVEDDASLGYVLKEYLGLCHYAVTWARDGVEALEFVRKNPYDLCLLDIMLPKTDGFTLASELKTLVPELPIIFLTARSLKIDKLKGFRLGADDYITKPVDEEELLARIKAVIGRTSRPQPSDTIVTIGSFKFDMSTSSLCSACQETYSLSNREAEVLKLLVRTQGRLVERRKILSALWGTNDYFARRSMDVIISRLRKYFKNDPSVAIVNVHSKGFILKTAEVDQPN